MDSKLYAQWTHMRNHMFSGKKGEKGKDQESQGSGYWNLDDPQGR
jgi:hypothetical protein